MQRNIVSHDDNSSPPMRSPASLASDLRVVVVEWHGGCFIRSIGYKTIINYPMIMYVHAEQPRKTEERAR